MGKITDITAQKNKDRLNIFLDGKFGFAVSLEAKVVNKLEIGKELSEESVSHLIFEDQVERLTNQSLRFLSFRPRSEKEICDQLTKKLRFSDKGEEEKKNFDKSVESVIRKLKLLKQLDDEEFAKWWVEQRLQFKQSSPREIKGELFAKGIDRDLIDLVLNQTKGNEETIARKALEKKAKVWSKLSPLEFKEKSINFLARKGFNWDKIKKVVDSYTREELE